MRLISILIPLVAAAGSASADTLDEGLHALVAGDYQSAARQLGTAVAERPRDPVAHFNYASALRELGQQDAAIAEYRAAFREGDDTMKSNALYGVGLTYSRRGDAARAEQAWRDYLSFASSRRADAAAVEVARENLAAAQRDLGTRKAAR